MDKIKIINELGFSFVETQEVDKTGERVYFYINNTTKYRIAYWKGRELFSLKNLKNTSTTMIISFESIMCEYFKNIC